METKENKAFIVWLAVLSLLVLGLGGYIVYDKFLSNNDTEEKDDVNDENENENDSDSDDIDDNDDNSKNQENNNNSKEDIYEKLLNGDFSGVAGEYVNSEGKTITLLSNGLLQGEDGFTTGKIKNVDHSKFSPYNHPRPFNNNITCVPVNQFLGIE